MRNKIDNVMFFFAVWVATIAIVLQVISITLKLINP